jgi:hypothetical protein
MVKMERCSTQNVFQASAESSANLAISGNTSMTTRLVNVFHAKISPKTLITLNKEKEHQFVPMNVTNSLKKLKIIQIALILLV